LGKIFMTRREIFMLKLKVKLFEEGVTPPVYAHPGDAGMDVYANESVVITPGERRAVKTGFATEFSPDYVALVWDRSSMALKKGVKTMAGVVDSGYRGEWMVVMINLGPEPVSINRGDKIAQAIFQQFATAEIALVEELNDSSRGVGGFGSTDVMS